MNPKIILVGGEARHGKNSTCDYLEYSLNQINKSCLQINFGDYVKFCYAMYDKGSKETIFDRTIENRSGWQNFGTEKVRSLDPNFWVNTVIRFVELMKEDYDYILISDMRFMEEYFTWFEYGYIPMTIHVERLGFDNGLTEEQKNHKSENVMKDFKYHYYLKAHNLEELHKEIDKQLGDLYE